MHANSLPNRRKFCSRGNPWRWAAPVGCLVVAAVGMPAASGAATHQVTVQNKNFIPPDLVIQVGDVVRWNWLEGIHTTTSGPPGTPDGTWDAPLDVSNTFFERTFTTTGFFSYFCLFHVDTGMTGTITVVTANSPPVVQNPGTQNGTELEFFSVTVTATDANGDALTMTDLDTHPPWSTFEDNGDNTCTLSGTPGVGEAGTYPVSVRASDGLATDTETFDIVIGAAPPVQVDLTAGGFVPGSVTILVGQSVRWVKVAGGNHTTTDGTGLADPNAGLIWDAELRAATPEFTFQFTNAGTFPYFCRAHPAETGTVVVDSPPTCVIVGPDPVAPGSGGLGYAAAVTPSTGTITYSWSIAGNGSIVGGTTGSSIQVDAGSPGSFTLDVDGMQNGVGFACLKTVTVSAFTAIGDPGSGGVLVRSTPNPFSSSVELRLSLDHAAKVRIDIFALDGRRVLGLLVAELSAGPHRVTWGGWDEHHRPVAPGVYFARVLTESGPGGVVRLFKTR